MKLKLTGLLIGILSLSFFACEKKVNNEQSNEKIFSKPEILVKHQWQVDEVWRNINGNNSHFVKNVLNTTGTNYDVMRISFKQDGTGTYIDENNVSHSITWKFTSANERNMQVIIGAPTAGSANFTWNIVEISEGSLINTTAVGNSILLTARYTPVTDTAGVNQ